MSETNWRPAFERIGIEVDDAIASILDQGKVITLPAKATVFHQGDACHNYLIVIDGSIRVFTRAENGREIVLYRLHSGDSCVLTTSCLFGKSHYPAEGLTETEVSAMAIPVKVFEKGIQQSDTFRRMVFNAFTTHVHLLITLVEEVAFGKLDIRLARRLLEHENGGDSIHITHQELATELGSAREVISRQLKELETRGIIALHRGSIEILDRGALAEMARQPSAR